ncbi:MAG: hypothetical protein ACR2PR_02160 [Pseudohongiellaceae bacterium]
MADKQKSALERQMKAIREQQLKAVDEYAIKMCRRYNLTFKYDEKRLEEFKNNYMPVKPIRMQT